MAPEPVITETTRTNYAHGWARFEHWCADNGHDPLSTDGATVAEWVYDMNNTPSARTGRPLAVGTIKLTAAAVTDYYRHRHPRGEQDDPTKTDEVRRALQHVTRVNARAGRTVRKAPPLTEALVEPLLRISVQQRSGETIDKAHRRHLELEATVRVMFDSALRGDELVNARWSDLSTAPNAKGCRTLHVPVSKTDQNGNGRHGNIRPRTWEALQRWRAVWETIPATAKRTGHISTAASTEALTARFKRLGKVAAARNPELAAAGIADLSAHSCRRGVATELGRRGASEIEISEVGGWKSSRVMREYVDAPNAADNAVAKYLLDDPADPAHSADPEARARADMAANAPKALAYVDRIVNDTIAGLPHIAALSMAVALGADPNHPDVHHARRRILDLWPDTPDCARPGCCGMVTVANPRPGERYCCARCRHIASETRRAARKATP